MRAKKVKNERDAMLKRFQPLTKGLRGKGESFGFVKLYKYGFLLVIGCYSLSVWNTYMSRLPGADMDLSSLLLGHSNGFPKERFLNMALTKIYSINNKISLTVHIKEYRSGHVEIQHIQIQNINEKNSSVLKILSTEM